MNESVTLIQTIEELNAAGDNWNFATSVITGSTDTEEIRKANQQIDEIQKRIDASIHLFEINGEGKPTGRKYRPVFPVTGHYTLKDQAKSDRANKFIGRGSSRSSTNRYREAWGKAANCGEYHHTDVVFVSAEGNRAGALSPDIDEIRLAAKEGAKFITDVPADRNRSYNSGERKVAVALIAEFYQETSPGFWERK